MRKLRKFSRSRRRPHAEIFARRAERFQSECGWCGKEIGEDEPVVAIGGRTHAGLDLSLLQGKVVELKFEAVDRIILAGVSAFDSDAKSEGKDLIFMTCSDECGREMQAAFAQDLARAVST